MPGPFNFPPHQSTITVDNEDMAQIIVAAHAFLKIVSDPENEETTMLTSNLEGALIKVEFAWVNSEKLQARAN